MPGTAADIGAGKTGKAAAQVDAQTAAVHEQEKKDMLTQKP